MRRTVKEKRGVNVKPERISLTPGDFISRSQGLPEDHGSQQPIGTNHMYSPFPFDYLFQTMKMGKNALRIIKHHLSAISSSPTLYINSKCTYTMACKSKNRNDDGVISTQDRVCNKLAQRADSRRREGDGFEIQLVGLAKTPHMSR